MNQKVLPNTHCRLCGSPDLRQFLDLGDQPPANAFISAGDIEKEERFPLRVAICAECGFVQLTHIVHPDILFREYVYVSSTSPLFVKHFEEYARDVSDVVGGVRGKLVVDIGSNDGILLRPFRDLGANVLGIDPAIHIAKKATEDGIETWAEYFGEEIGKMIRNKKGAVISITANNVFAHIHDLNDILRGVNALLADDGVFVIEAPDLAVLLRDKLFDTVYHEHLSYISVRPLLPFFRRHDMRVFDVKDVSTHGGSLRIFVCRDGGPHIETERLRERVKKEEESHIQDPATFTEFAKEVDRIKVELNNLLSGLKKQGKRIAGYGAPAKGNTLLNYFSIGPDILEYIVDDNSLKQGKLTPGMHIPVVSNDKLRDRTPDYLLILAWNYAEAIMKKNEAFRADGGKFIIPLPQPRVV